MKKGVVLYLDPIAAIMRIAEDEISDMDYWEVGVVFTSAMEYAIRGEDLLTGVEEAIDEGILENGVPCSERARSLYRLLMQMIDESENVYQQRVRRKKEIINHTDDIRRLV